jgi:hypothetical protein
MMTIFTPMDITPTLPLIMTVLESLVSFLNTFCLLLRFCPVDTDFHEPTTEDTWNDLTDKQGNKLHVGKLEFKMKHGKKPNSFIKYVHPRDVKSALCFLVRLSWSNQRFPMKIAKFMIH